MVRCHLAQQIDSSLLRKQVKKCQKGEFSLVSLFYSLYIDLVRPVYLGPYCFFVFFCSSFLLKLSSFNSVLFLYIYININIQYNTIN